MLGKTRCEIKKRVNDTEVALMADVTMVWLDMWGVTIGKQVRLHPFKDLVPSRNNRNRQSSIGSQPLFAERTQIHCCSYGHRTSHLEGGHGEIEPNGAGFNAARMPPDIQQSRVRCGCLRVGYSIHPFR